MRTPQEILYELERRGVHVRQYLGKPLFEVWADGVFKSWWRRPLDAEVAIRELLGISNAEGEAVERELGRQDAVS